ncbi:MAG: DEAD/DEAH box helicase [Gemmobacter sp.]|jgi:ATP-dependent RNA helicase RhlE|nr:DEAD/DEAH box helicase [Gemmobacter sp.]
MTTFADLGLSPKLLKALETTGFTAPTPIQVEAIPSVMKGRDLMGLAQTGTGKTAAFGLPLLHRLLDVTHPPGPRNVRALILAPTRELVQQIHEHLFAFTKGTPVKLTMVVGGASINKQSERLAKGTDVLIATPGRLIDLLERGDVRLDACGYLVLDEADHMLDMGFIHALRTIAKHLPHKRQTLLFSATMPKDIEEIAATYLREPVRVQVAPPGKPVERISQGVHFIPQGDKAKLLESYLQKHPGEAAIVFSRTKHGADQIAQLLGNWGFSAGAIHGNRSQNQRARVLAEFREGTLMVLVATDVAARGIDIPVVRHVYNYDMPNVAENYVHRIGRTARAGADGSSVSFCAPAEMEEFTAIEKLLKKPLPVLGGAPWAMEAVKAATKPGQNRPSRGGAPRPAKPGQPSRPRDGQHPARAAAGKPTAAPGRPANAGRKPQGGMAAPRRPRG